MVVLAIVQRSDANFSYYLYLYCLVVIIITPCLHYMYSILSLQPRRVITHILISAAGAWKRCFRFSHFTTSRVYLTVMQQYSIQRTKSFSSERLLTFEINNFLENGNFIQNSITQKYIQGKTFNINLIIYLIFLFFKVFVYSICFKIGP